MIRIQQIIPTVLLGTAFSVIGMILFLYCLVVVRKILDLFPKAKMRKDWMIIGILIAFFAIGYAVNIWALLANNLPVQTFMQSFVYLFGAIFVFVVIQLSFRTYKLILKSAEE
jgi:O-antigen/teichoic acid export membrane protein